MATAPETPDNIPVVLRLSGSMRPRLWLARHLYAIIYTFGQLVRSPASTLTTSAVIGITLALPGVFYVLLQNAQTASHAWDGGAQLSLYLAEAVTESDALALAEELRGWPEVDRVDVITPAQALQEYKQLAGFDDLDAALGRHNPLPFVLLVFPSASTTDPPAMERLVSALRSQRGVDMVQSDIEWIARLQAMMDIGRRSVMTLSLLFALGALLIIGNTIRLAIQNRRDEIEVAKLVGATDAFIRRPFLYSGLWYGLLGAAIAWLLIATSLHMVDEPVSRLASLYQSNFGLRSLDGAAVGALFIIGAGLGWLGSWAAVFRHLHAIEPT